MHFSEHRTLIQALALSALAHAVLLIGAVTTYRPEVGVPAASMRVVIGRERRAESLKSVVAEPSKPLHGLEMNPVARPIPRKEVAVSPRPATRRAEQPQIASREASPVIAPAVPASSATAFVEASPPASSSSSSSSSSAGIPVAAETASAREGVSADDLRQYRVSLASAARRFKRYPALAKEQGWEGTVEVAIRFSSALPAPDVALVRSSGRDLLDEQALEMLAQAARATALPEGLRGRDFQIPLPVKFSLDDAR